MMRQSKIRLSTEGAAATKRDLRGVGEIGDRALARIRDGAQPASRGLKAVDGAAREARQSVEQMAGRAGPLGTVLGSFGNAGLAAAAGIGALALGLGGASRIAREAVADFDAIGKSADKIGVSTALLQEMRFAGGSLAGMLEGQVDTSLQRFVRRVSEAANGTGEARGALEELGVQLRDGDGRLRSADDLLGAVADGMSGLESDADRLRIAVKLFDTEGAAMVNVLKDSGAAMDDTRERARALGVVVDEDMIRNAARVQDEFDAAAKVIDVNLKQAFIDLAPVLLSVSEGFVTAAQSLSGFVDLWRGLDTMSVAGLQQKVEGITAEIDKIEDRLSKDRQEPDRSRRKLSVNRRQEFIEEITALMRERAGFEEEIARRKSSFEMLPPALPSSFAEPPAKSSGGGVSASGSGVSAPASSPLPRPRDPAMFRHDAAALASIEAVRVAQLAAYDQAVLKAQEWRTAALDGLNEQAAGFIEMRAEVERLYGVQIAAAESARTENEAAAATEAARAQDERAREGERANAGQAFLEMRKAIASADQQRLDILERTAVAADEARSVEDMRRVLDMRDAALLQLEAQQEGARAVADLLREQADASIGLLGTARALAEAAVYRADREREVAEEIQNQGAVIEQQKKDQERYDVERAEERRRRDEDARRDAERAEQDRTRAIENFAGGLSRAVIAGGDLNDVLKNVLQSVVQLAIETGVVKALFEELFGGGGAGSAAGGGASSLASAAGNVIGTLFAADGAAFDGGGQVTAFAKGGVVDGATPFTFGAGRLGVMGEAGPEAILPLRRGSDGRLGVSGAGGTVINQTNHFSAGVNGADRAQIHRAIVAANNEVLKKVPGISLNATRAAQQRRML